MANSQNANKVSTTSGAIPITKQIGYARPSPKFVEKAKGEAEPDEPEKTEALEKNKEEVEEKDKKSPTNKRRSDSLAD